jgi:hypothetical protein
MFMIHALAVLLSEISNLLVAGDIARQKGNCLIHSHLKQLA